ncbi:MAG: ATP-binding protein, partial [Gaiellaceae bacterium]
VDDLWGESPPETAAESVRVFVWKLRKAVGPVLRTHRPGYLLEVGEDELDRARFEHLLAEGRQALADGDPASAAAVLHEAIALWRGPPLADFTYEPFAQAEIARLEELRLVALEERIEADLRLGGKEEVLAVELEALAFAHPYRERLRGQYIRALYRAGRQADALAAYQEARRTLREQLGIDPGPALKRLERQILQQDAALVETANLRLPAPASRLIGREQELATLQKLLTRPDVRLVTLTGAGGSGKTRLALEAASRVARAFDDGATWVDLAPLAEPDLVLSTVSRKLGMREHAGEAVRESVTRFLAPRHVLLVLDSFEHLLPAAIFVAELIETTPRVHILVTSRAPLRLSAEREFPVHPLPQEDASALFVERARAVRPEFRVAAEDVAVIREICERVDRLPLAIELASARMKLLPPRVLLAQLEPSLPLLVAGTRDAPARQRTLKATIDWSYELLDERQRTLFARLAVFAGGCSLDAAGWVCGAELPELAELVDESLLRVRDGPGGEPRLSMLETTREYALERLQASGDEETVRRAHAAHYVSLAEQTAAGGHAGSGDGRWADRLDADHDNLRAALRWLDRAGETELQLRLASALGHFWGMRGYVAEGWRWLERSLAMQWSDRRLLARARLEGSRLAHELGEYSCELDLLAEALSDAQALGDPALVGDALLSQARLAVIDGDYDRAEALVRQASRSAAGTAGTELRARAAVQLGQVALYRKQHDRAHDLLEQGLAAYRALGDRAAAAWALKQTGELALARGSYERASALIRMSLAGLRELGWRSGIIVDGGLEGLAAVAAIEGRAQRAATLVGAASASREHGGRSLAIPFERSWHERTVEAVRSRLGEEPFAEALELGRAMSLDEALEYALEEPVKSASGDP